MSPKRRSWWWMAPWPRRTLWPTRDGWWCLFAVMGLGFAAINTGNNLLYLLVSMLLGLIVVSGILSEQSIRGVRLSPVVPDDVYAGRAVHFGIRVVNRKRWTTSYSLMIEPLAPGGVVEARVFVPRLEHGGERLVTWERALATRGLHPFPAVRIATRFPFGLFVKAGQITLDAEVLVFPAVSVLAPEQRRWLGGSGRAPTRRRGRGHDLYNLREYRSGDDPRLIHWRSSAKSSPALIVRELTEESAVDTRLVLEGQGVRDADRRERGLAEAASWAVHLVRAGAAVELAGRGVHVPLGRGRAQARKILTALALYDPTREAPAAPAPRPPGDGRMREIRVALD